MRGKPDGPEGIILESRITPAHAGKTGSTFTGWATSSDHPRACGENLIILNQNLRRGGSPPRMRGKHKGTAAQNTALRITPAHAGKTSERMPCVRQIADHPRACGENRFFTRKATLWGGSPPRMRGKPVLCKENLCSDRITPAHAGKTQSVRER